MPSTKSRAALIAAALPLLLLSACSSSPAPITAHGTLTVDYTPPGSGGAGDDLSDGGQVVVVNSAGAVVGSATLNQTGGGMLDDGSGDMDDVFSFTVTVPGGLPRYGIQAGGTSHGTVWESAAEMKSGPSLTIDETTDGTGGF